MGGGKSIALGSPPPPSPRCLFVRVSLGMLGLAPTGSESPARGGRKKIHVRMSAEKARKGEKYIFTT